MAKSEKYLYARLEITKDGGIRKTRMGSSGKFAENGEWVRKVADGIKISFRPRPQDSQKRNKTKKKMEKENGNLASGIFSPSIFSINARCRRQIEFREM